MTAAFSLAVTPNPNGSFSVLANTSTVSTQTGAITLAGGLGVGGGIYVGGVVTATNFVGNVTGDVSGGASQIYLNTTTANSASTGSWLIPFVDNPTGSNRRSEEHTSELQSH